LNQNALQDIELYLKTRRVRIPSPTPSIGSEVDVPELSKGNSKDTWHDLQYMGFTLDNPTT